MSFALLCCCAASLKSSAHLSRIYGCLPMYATFTKLNAHVPRRLQARSHKYIYFLLDETGGGLVVGTFVGRVALAMASSSSPTSFSLSEPDFGTVTCVAWSPSGRNIGIGTPDGLLLYSTESVLEAGITRAATAPTTGLARATSTGEDVTAAGSQPQSSQSKQQQVKAESSIHNAAESIQLPQSPGLQEVCRRVIPGGVGLLSLYGQSSVVVLAGVADRASAATVRVVDTSRPLCPFSTELDGVPYHDQPPSNSAFSEKKHPSESGEGSDDGAPLVSPGESQEQQQLFPGAGTSRFLPMNATDLRPLILAEAAFPTAVSSVHFSPYFIIVTLTGDPRIPGSHQLYVFDLHLQQKLVFSPFPSRSNRFLHDCISLAGMWAPVSGAGVFIRRFRALLPGPHRGAVRLLTLKHVSLIPSASSAATTSAPSTGPRVPAGSSALSCPYPPYSLYGQLSPRGHGLQSQQLNNPNDEEEALYVGDKVLHKAPLRAVAIAQDGKYGVTIGEKGTNIKLIEFVNDTTIVERLTLERGKMQAITDSASLCIVPVPSPASTPAATTAVERVTLPTPTGASCTAKHLVVCITSSGTVHLFLCDAATSRVVYSREKTLCPLPGQGFPYAFSAMIPHHTVTHSSCGLYVLQWNERSNGASYLAHQESGTVGFTPPRTAASYVTVPIGVFSPTCGQRSAGQSNVRLVAFDVAYSYARSRQAQPRNGSEIPRVVSSTTPEGTVWCTPFEAYYFPSGK